ncbi:MAG: asparagine synthase (glutamine-hydrolyzing) [Ramlibacter sp.]|uniref:asparagine synthase (glutamine-hydrolyzing) n=1 Tax=Ramlibacter sp. TaxID=1917967 RepID=UPI0026382865|nr:asparagine synthase (glutamine-hydrolyzing) [Ramlibacter sp.]MDH4377716.1 asparagine synthase (glutamine-hydrolyzing) [Ramlibacter sp.]
MCGITGVLALPGSAFEVTTDFVVKMRDTMTHRGPDGSGAWVSPDGRIGLGHRRLSIIDLADTAGQPMDNEDGSLQVVFNGEIYNHAEIRKELEALGGHRWKTDHSDTEVILHAFEQWGIACIQRFRGMFAIALWDERTSQLWLVRDRMGVKPLYYSIHHGRLTFASEIKALLADPEQRRAVNEAVLPHYLSFLTTPAPDTLFEGVKKLPCATWMRIDPDGSMHETRYWDPLDHPRNLDQATEDQVAQAILEELKVAVRLRKVSDVPVGVFLSGGIDSSTNAALFSDGAGEAVRTFSIGYAGEHASYQNELHYARRVADEVGAQHYEKLLTVEDLLAFLPEMIRLQDEPIADPVCFPVYFVSKLARDNGVTVCQVGEGADELFWGYPGWRTALRLQHYNDWPVPRVFKRWGLAAMRLLGKDGSFSYEWLRRGSEDLPVFWGGAEAFTETHKRRLLGPRLRAASSGTTSWEVLKPIWERFCSKSSPRPSWLGWMTYLDLNLRLPELLLMRVDKMSMGVGLEGRVPFLDHKLVELAMSIPEATKTRNGTLKYILKRAVRGLIPDEIVDRPKQGFGVPIHDWFLDRLGSEIRRELEEFCAQTDFFDRTEVFRLIEEKKAAQVWYLFNFALWWKAYIRA